MQRKLRACSPLLLENTALPSLFTLYSLWTSCQQAAVSTMYSLLKAQKWWQTNECLADTQVCNLWPTEHSLLYLIIGWNSQILTFISVWLGGPSTLASVLLKLNIKPQNQRWMYHILLIYSLCSYHCCQCLDIWEMKERLRQVFPF